MLIAAGAFLTDVDRFLWKSQSELVQKLGVCLYIFLSPRRVSFFLAWGDFHARSRFARSTIPEEKWGTTRSLVLLDPLGNTQ